MPFCPHCGKGVDGDYAFCPACGMKLPSSPGQGEPTSANASSTAADNLISAYARVFQSLSEESHRQSREYPLDPQRRPEVITAIVTYWCNKLFPQDLSPSRPPELDPRAYTLYLSSVWNEPSTLAKSPQDLLLVSSLIKDEPSFSPTYDEMLTAVAYLVIRLPVPSTPVQFLFSHPKDQVAELQKYRKTQHVMRVLRGLSFVGATWNLITAIAAKSAPKPGSPEYYVLTAACAQNEAILLREEAEQNRTLLP